MAYSFLGLATLQNRQLTYTSDGSQPLSAYTSAPTYVQIINPLTNQKSVISLSQAMLRISGIDMTQSVATFIGTFTDLMVATYVSTIVPFPNSSGQQINTIRAFNPISVPDLSVSFTSLNNPGSRDDPKKATIYNDLVITSNGVRDLSSLIVAVNGVIHPTIFWENELYVIDGFATMRVSGRTDMVCYDTSAVGGHTAIPLTTDMVTYKNNSNDGYITLPTGMSFTDKTVFVVIDGYLYHPEEVLEIMSDNLAHLKMNLIPFLQQFRHNPKTQYSPDIFGDNWDWGTPLTEQTPPPPPVQTGNWVSANLDPYIKLFQNARCVPMSTFTAEAFPQSRVTAPHSALILVNKSALFVNRTRMIPSLRLGSYEYIGTPTPQGITRYGYGLSPSYALLSNADGQNWYLLDQYDSDMDRTDYNWNASVVPALIDERDKTAMRNFEIFTYFSA